MRKYLVACLMVVAVLSAPIVPADAGNDAVPANYKLLVARKILGVTDRKSIRSARISAPAEQWVGLLTGFRPVVCVELFRENMLKSSARDLWVFTFENGLVAKFTQSNIDCGPLAPFDELRQTRSIRSRGSRRRTLAHQSEDRSDDACSQCSQCRGSKDLDRYADGSLPEIHERKIVEIQNKGDEEHQDRPGFETADERPDSGPFFKNDRKQKGHR